MAITYRQLYEVLYENESVKTKKAKKSGDLTFKLPENLEIQTLVSMDFIVQKKKNTKKMEKKDK